MSSNDLGQLGESHTGLPPKTLEYIHTQLKWVGDQVAHHTRDVFEEDGVLYKKLGGHAVEVDEETKYWLSVECVLIWVAGMYNALKVENSWLTFDKFIALPYMADLEDILEAYGSEDYISKVVSTLA